MRILLLGCLLASIVLPAAPPAGDLTKRVVFPKGKTTVSYSGKMPKVYEGYDSYLLRARKGQTLSVSLSAADPAASVAIYETKVLDPEHDTILGNDQKLRDWTGKLPVNGEYEVQVYTTEPPPVPSASAAYSIKITLR